MKILTYHYVFYSIQNAFFYLKTTWNPLYFRIPFIID